MKVLLIDHGAYVGMGGVEFPVEVEAMTHKDIPSIKVVSGSELIRVGGMEIAFEPEEYYSFRSHSIEMISDADTTNQEIQNESGTA